MDLGNLRSPVKPCEYCVCDVTPPGVVPFRVRRGARIRHASAIYMIVVDKHIGSREKRKRSRRACPSIITSTLLNAPPPVAGPRGARGRVRGGRPPRRSSGERRTPVPGTFYAKSTGARLVLVSPPPRAHAPARGPPAPGGLPMAMRCAKAHGAMGVLSYGRVTDSVLPYLIVP